MSVVRSYRNSRFSLLYCTAPLGFFAYDEIDLIWLVYGKSVDMLLRGRVYRVHACGSDTVVVERDMIWVIKVVVMKVRLKNGS